MLKDVFFHRDEIFVKTLLPDPDNEKVDRSDLLAHIGRWVLGIGVLGLLSIPTY